jgi:DNA-binding MarR family transcriptional regulator
MDNPYLEVISYVERIHRRFLEVVKLELEGFGIHDINNVQAMMLFNIGDAEMTVGELTLRGCYLGSNVSYNVRKMVENEYLAHERSVHDRRSIHVRLTEKGIKLRDSLTTMHRRQAEMLSRAAVGADDLQAVGVTLRRLELLDPRRRLSAATAAAGTAFFVPRSAAFRLMHDLRPGG